MPSPWYTSFDWYDVPGYDHPLYLSQEHAAILGGTLTNDPPEDPDWSAIDSAVAGWIYDDTSATRTALDPFLGGTVTTSNLLTSLPGVYFPEAYGAVGNGTTDDTAALQAAIDAATAAPAGGTVFLSKKYAWTGDLFVKGGVCLQGSGMPRRFATPQVEGNLIALGASSRVRYGQWGGGSGDDNPSPMRNLTINGNFLATELVRMECTDGLIDGCAILQCAPGGVTLQVGRSQNSRICNFYIGFSSGGTAIDFFEGTNDGAGNVHFSHGYVATSRYMLTSGGVNGKVGPHDCSFTDVLFENYIGGNDLLWLKAGEFQFRNCVFTNSGASPTLKGPTAHDNLVQIENDTIIGTSTTATFDSCYFGSSGGLLTDHIRVKNGGALGQVANKVHVYGRSHWSFGTNTFCVDGGGYAGSFQSAIITVQGEHFRINGSDNWVRTVNGGQLTSFVAKQAIPMRITAPGDGTDSSGTMLPALDLRNENDAASRIRLITTAGGTGLFLYDGADGSTARGSWYWDNTSGDEKMILGKIQQIANGIAVRSSQTNVGGTGVAVAIDASGTGAPTKIINYTVDNGSATVTVSGGSSNSLLFIDLFANGHTGCTVTWPSTFKFSGTVPQPSGAGGVSVIMKKRPGTSDWYPVAGLASASSGSSASSTTFTPAGNIAATNVQAALEEVDTEKQPVDATLTALAAVVTAANKLIYATGVDTFTTADLTAFARTLLDDADASTALSTLGVSAYAKTLLDDADASTAQSTLGISTFIKTLLDDADASTAQSTLGISAFIKTLLDDADAATARTTLGVPNSPQINEYTTAGNSTYTIPTGAKVLEIEAMGGGGGGGSGRLGAAASVRGGGGGGGGSARSVRTVPVSDLGGATSLYLTVGAGGTGGAAVSTASTDGNAGTAGTASFVKSANVGIAVTNAVLYAAGGNGGAAGTSGTAAGGVATTLGMWGGGAGGAGASGGGVGGAGSTSTGSAPGAGAGGGLSVADAQAAGGASGAVGGGTTGTVAGGSAGGGNGTAGQDFPVLGPGQAGGGGGSNNAGAGGAGGNGARGAPGGGGGGATNGSTSGAGGNGGDGYVKITAWF